MEDLNKLIGYRPMKIRILPPLKEGGDVFAQRTRTYTGKPVPKYFWPVVIRGKEDQGPVIWSMGQSMHSQLIKALSSMKIKKRLPWWKRLINWLLGRPNPLLSPLDELWGHDVIVSKASPHGLNQYNVQVDPRGSRLGSAERVEVWKKMNLLDAVLPEEEHDQNL
jgi:hypothetical protein